MENSSVNKGRRRFLIAATSVVGAVGVTGMATPFLNSWNPSERAKAAGAPVEFNVSRLQEGQQAVVVWRKKPIWVVNRSEKMLNDLTSNDELLRDPTSEEHAEMQPDYALNAKRTREGHDRFLVLIGICTHLGCSPDYRPDLAPADLGSNWKGGWLCACHGSKFDLAGRVFQNVPADRNLEVPPYSYKDDNTILIGIDERGEAA
ncbi:MAG TPA: ubiquinol-cytochrome c reductase iron-sulfur subunit [Thiotrichaceae bacterium]|nr:ubiquinol-cytochrome c reductase iron-sulfur subunit [Thiotrichaceae bacterium]